MDVMKTYAGYVRAVIEKTESGVMREFVALHIPKVAEMLLGDCMALTCTDDEKRITVNLENIRSNAMVAVLWEKHYNDSIAGVSEEIRSTLDGMAMSEFAELRARLQVRALKLMKKSDKDGN